LLSGAARLIENTVRQESTMETLKILAKELNEQEKQEFIAWAQRQADAISVSDAESLYGDTYLRVERPFSDSPSLLDLPENTELINHYFWQKR
jgi:hypothetical protein